MKRILLVAFAFGVWGCSSSKRIEHLGTPRIVVRNANWEKISAAIAAFNFAKGRKLDLARQNELVLYEVKPDTSGHPSVLQILSKMVYDFTFSGDSVIVTSRLYRTHDLDDTSIAEDDDTTTLMAEQNELSQIAHSIGNNGSGAELAMPASTK